MWWNIPATAESTEAERELLTWETEGKSLVDQEKVWKEEEKDEFNRNADCYLPLRTKEDSTAAYLSSSSLSVWIPVVTLWILTDTDVDPIQSYIYWSIPSRTISARPDEDGF